MTAGRTPAKGDKTLANSGLMRVVVLSIFAFTPNIIATVSG